MYVQAISYNNRRQPVIAEPLTVTLAEAQVMSGLSRMTLLRRADAGELETRLICNRRLVVVSSLRKMLGFDPTEVAAAANL
jgi:hypothetical protein